MDNHKPVHLIFSDPLVFRALRFYHIDYYVSAQDYEGNSIHYHVLAAWPVRTTPRGFKQAKPPKNNFCRALRRLKACHHCKTWRNGNYCYICHLDVNFKWCKDPKHFENTYTYIARKPGATIYQPLLGEHQTRPRTEQTKNNTERSNTRTLQQQTI